MSENNNLNCLDMAEKLIVERLQRYAKRTSINKSIKKDGILKASKVISIVRERFNYVRSGKLPVHEKGKGERKILNDIQKS